MHAWARDVESNVPIPGLARGSGGVAARRRGVGKTYDARATSRLLSRAHREAGARSRDAVRLSVTPLTPTKGGTSERHSLSHLGGTGDRGPNAGRVWCGWAEQRFR